MLKLKNLNKEDLKTMSDNVLIDLLEDFVKMLHYEAVDEFEDLRQLDIDYSDVRQEVLRRLKGW